MITYVIKIMVKNLALIKYCHNSTFVIFLSMIVLLFFLRAEDDALVIDWVVGVDNLLWVAAIAKPVAFCSVGCQYNAINLNFIFKSKSVPSVVPYLGRTFKHDCKKLTEQKIQGNQLTHCWPFQRRYSTETCWLRFDLIELVIEFSDCTNTRYVIDFGPNL